jgi:thioredoxin-disulfide reductase
MHDLIIIGAGIAGLTAAMYAARKKLKFEILAAEFGGNFMMSGEIMNYPGVVKTTGVEFLQIMEKQMAFNDVKVKHETVIEIKRHGSNFKVITNKNKYDTITVIIATGAIPRKLNIPGEETYAKKGVTYCSTCDGPLFAGMDVAVIGGGNSALSAAYFLKDIASKIYLLVLEDEFNAHESLIERIKKTKKIKVMFKVKTKEIVGNKFVSGLRYVHNKKQKGLDVKGIIIEIGRVPNTEPFKKLAKLDEQGHIMIDSQAKTNVPGIFAAGDCASGQENQYVIAAGQGCMALLKAAKYIAFKKE